MNVFVLLISINGFNYQKVILRIPAINTHMHITHTHNVEPTEIIFNAKQDLYFYISLRDILKYVSRTNGEKL